MQGLDSGVLVLYRRHRRTAAPRAGVGCHRTTGRQESSTETRELPIGVTQRYLLIYHWLCVNVWQLTREAHDADENHWDGDVQEDRPDTADLNAAYGLAANLEKHVLEHNRQELPCPAGQTDPFGVETPHMRHASFASNALIQAGDASALQPLILNIRPQ